jgi:hypothetical protein
MSPELVRQITRPAHPAAKAHQLTYEEALADWLLRSRARTEEQMTDLEGRVFAFEWRVPHDSPVAMLA